MTALDLHNQFDQAQATAAQIADDGTIEGLRSQGLVIIDVGLLNRLLADSQKLRSLETEAELHPLTWPDSIDAWHTDHGSRGES